MGNIKRPSYEQRAAKSGIVFCDGCTLEYDAPGEKGWNIALSEIVVIGEYVNEDPIGDEYTFVFVTDSSKWYEMLFNAAGFEEAMKAVGGLLGFQPTYELVSKATFDSIVVWPTPLKGEPLFHFAEIKKWWHVWGSNPILVTLSPQVEKHIAELRGKG